MVGAPFSLVYGLADGSLLEVLLPLVEKGCENLLAHVETVRKSGVSPVVCINNFYTDTQEEVDLIRKEAEAAGALVIRHEINKGKGMAMNSAFKWAKESGAQAMVMLDGDGQHDPGHIPIVLEPVLVIRSNKYNVSGLTFCFFKATNDCSLTV
jgi:hypothetical protein